MDRYIFIMHRNLYWWKKYGIERQEKSAFSGSAFYRVIETGTLLLNMKLYKNIYLGLNIVVFKALRPYLLPFNFVSASICQLT